MVDPRTRLRIATAKRDLLLNWQEGVSIETRTGANLRRLQDRVTADRIDLAYAIRRSGKRLMRLSPPLYRDAVGRFYYAMYHAMRAVVFFTNQGDDFEAHSELPGHAPADFPSSAAWTNTLKSARALRNAADYDAYPKSVNRWESSALGIERDADSLLPIARQYLRSKGCQYL